MPGSDVWFAGLLGKVQHDGAPVELGGGLNFLSPLSAELNPATQMIDVSVGGLDGVLPGESPGDDGKLAYWLLGELHYADDVKTDGTDLELSDGASVTFGAAYLALTRSGDVLNVGDTEGSWTSMTFGAPSGFVFSFGGGFDATITPSGMFLDDLDLDIGLGDFFGRNFDGNTGAFLSVQIKSGGNLNLIPSAGEPVVVLLTDASRNAYFGSAGTNGSTANIFNTKAGGVHLFQVDGAEQERIGPGTRGFFGVSPVTRPQVTASGVTAADLLTALNSLGLLESI